MLGLSRREQFLCIGLLTMILVLSVTGAWLIWRALSDQQVQLQGRSALKTEVTDGHSLGTELTKRDPAGLTKQSGSGSSGLTSSSGRNEPSGRTAPSLKTSKPTTIDGTIVAAVVTVVLLGAAAGAVRLVLARYRRQRTDDAGPGRPERFLLDLIDEEPEADSGSEDDESREPDLPADVSVRQDEEASPAAEEHQPLIATESAELEPSGLDVPGELSPGTTYDAGPTAPPESESLLQDRPAVPAQRASSWDVRQDATVSGKSSEPLTSPLLEESSSFGVPSKDAASENIFDRRVARRVPHVESAWLWWGDVNGPVMVQDLSATGLRLRFPPAGSAPPPTLNQPLRIFFPVSGTTVKAQGRVQWRRTVDGATEVGLQFLDLPASANELIEAVLLAAE